jgi:D-alanyl-D-alanine carboxypeptidase
MRPSGNDVANALAEHVAGSLEAFVALMNQRAYELGAYNTNFINPCGLPGDGQHTTAFDMSLIMREAVRNPIFNQVISTPRFEIQPLSNFTEGLEVINTNRMIRPETYEFNPAVVGGKTGFTNAAQHTLVSYAERGEHSYIVTVLYAPRGATFTDTANLLDYAFTFPVVNIYEVGETNFEIPVMQYINGERTLIDNLAVVGEQGLSIPLPTNISIRQEVVLPTDVSPPVRMGEELGSISFFAGDDFIGEVALVASETVFPRIGTLMAADTELELAYGEVAIPADSPSHSMVPFFTILPLVTILIVGFTYVMFRRHRNIVKRRRRRMARIKRITESGYITTSRSQYRYEVIE